MLLHVGQHMTLLTHIPHLFWRLFISCQGGDQIPVSGDHTGILCQCGKVLNRFQCGQNEYGALWPSLTLTAHEPHVDRLIDRNNKGQNKGMIH